MYVCTNSFSFSLSPECASFSLGIQVPGVLATSSATILLQVGKLRPGLGGRLFQSFAEKGQNVLFQSGCFNGQEMCQYLLMAIAASLPLVNTSGAGLVSPSLRLWLCLSSASPPQVRSL